MTAAAAAEDTPLVPPPAGVPEPDKVVLYGSKCNSALYLYGDASSPQMALLSAGFPDDHTIMQPFAKALSENNNGMLVGVMCIPGFDDRPEAPWTSHDPNGYTFEDWAQNAREAATVLRETSTHEKAEFIGIFHDYGVMMGSKWVCQLEEEAKDAKEPDPTKPDKMVFFDVLFNPSPNAKDVPSADQVYQPTGMEFVRENFYRYVLAAAFWLQRFGSRTLAPILMGPWFILMDVFRLGPTDQKFERKFVDPLYAEKGMAGLHRVLYMSYPYWTLAKQAFKDKTIDTFANPSYCHHADWKTIPILYLYGTKKLCMFHSHTTLKMLEREQAEGRSLSKAVAVEGTGHNLYVQKPDECLKHVLDFINAENTFRSS